MLPWSVKTANYTVINGERIIVNSTAGSFNITLPLSPAAGDYIQITDGGNLSVNNVTVLRNSSTIEGIADDVILTIPSTTYEFIYTGTTWQVTATAGAKGDNGFVGSVGTIGFTGSRGPSNIQANEQYSNYTLQLSDVSKHISVTNTSNVTVPSSVFSAGDPVSIYNNTSTNISILQGSGVTMYLVGTATTGTRTLAQRGLATVLCVSANNFVVTGGGLS